MSNHFKFPPKMSLSIIVLSGDDWQALYFNNIKVDESHSLDHRVTFEKLFLTGKAIDSYIFIDVTEYGWGYGDPDAFPQILNLTTYRKNNA